MQISVDPQTTASTCYSFTDYGCTAARLHHLMQHVCIKNNPV